MFFLIRGRCSEASFLSFESQLLLFPVCAVWWLLEGSVTVMGRVWETELGKVKPAFVYVQVLGNLSECSENQSVIRNISPASLSCVPQAACEGCSVWNAQAGGSVAKAGVTAPALLCKHSLCRSGPAYLSLWLRVRHSCSGCGSVPPSCRLTQLRPLGTCWLGITEMYFLYLYIYTQVGLLVHWMSLAGSMSGSRVNRMP